MKRCNVSYHAANGFTPSAYNRTTQPNLGFAPIVPTDQLGNKQNYSDANITNPTARCDFLVRPRILLSPAYCLHDFPHDLLPYVSAPFVTPALSNHVHFLPFAQGLTQLPPTPIPASCPVITGLFAPETIPPCDSTQLAAGCSRFCSRGSYCCHHRGGVAPHCGANPFDPVDYSCDFQCQVPAARSRKLSEATVRRLAKKLPTNKITIMDADDERLD